MKPRESGWSDMEWQVRNWLYFAWLSGDHICEQHVHNLDVMNWAIGSHPVKAYGMGGRQVRTSPAYGHIFDHFAIDYEYPNGVHVASYARQIEGTDGNVSEAVTGTNGAWDSNGYRFTGGYKTRLRLNEINPYVQEHIDLLKSIRSGQPLNELTTVAHSTLTAIMDVCPPTPARRSPGKRLSTRSRTWSRPSSSSAPCPFLPSRFPVRPS